MASVVVVATTVATTSDITTHSVPDADTCLLITLKANIAPARAGKPRLWGSVDTQRRWDCYAWFGEVIADPARACESGCTLPTPLENPPVSARAG